MCGVDWMLLPRVDNSSDYLDMLQLFAVLQMAHIQLNFLFQ